MEDRPVGSILVNNRTIDIAGEVLAIRQIVRLKELEYVRKNGFSTGRTLMIVGALAVAFFSRSMFPSYAYSSSDTGSTVSVVVSITLTDDAPLLATYARNPSGLIATDAALFPTVSVVATVSVTALITVTLFEPTPVT